MALQEAEVGRTLSTVGMSVVLMLGVFEGCLCAQNIEGTAIITRKLTKRRVTAPVPAYNRGPVVELNTEPEEDPLAFERSRVAVYLEGPVSQSVSPTARVVTMEQRNRRFWPEMLVIQAGSKVSFPNLDPIFHNVFSLSGPKTFDLGNYSKGETRVVTFPHPGIVYVNCHLHANMTATIVVTPNQWNAIAGRDGAFIFRNVPPGKYTVVAWHQAAGYFRQSVEVLHGRDEHVEFLIPLDGSRHSFESSGLASGK